MKEEIIEYMMKVQVDQIVEEEEREFQVVGDEYHAELEQFGAGGIPVSSDSTPRRPGSRSSELHTEVEGGVKRKKTRRSRRG